jgi:hypothetical protein
MGLRQNAAKSMQSQVGVLQGCKDGQIGILVGWSKSGWWGMTSQLEAPIWIIWIIDRIIYDDNMIEIKDGIMQSYVRVSSRISCPHHGVRECASDIHRKRVHAKSRKRKLKSESGSLVYAPRLCWVLPRSCPTFPHGLGCGSSKHPAWCKGHTVWNLTHLDAKNLRRSALHTLPSKGRPTKHLLRLLPYKGSDGPVITSMFEQQHLWETQHDQP